MRYGVDRWGSLTAVVAVTVVMSGCSGSGGSSADKEAFCEGLAALIASVETSDPSTFARSLDDLARVAPSDDLRRAASTLGDTYALIAEVPTGDVEALEKVFSEIDEASTNDAVMTLETYGVDECGIYD